MKEKDLASSIIARQFWLIVILIIALVGTNIGWLIYESQYETIAETSEISGDNNNYIGNDGVINNGD